MIAFPLRSFFASAARPFRVAAALTGLLCAGTQTASAAVLLQDSFNNNVVATPDSTTIGNWTNYSTTAVTEANGTLTVATTASTASSSSNFSTAVRPELNPFTQTIQFAVREFSLSGTGDYASDSLGRFRIGLTSTLGSFYGADDTFALEISSGGLAYKLGTQFNNTMQDPGSATASGTVASAITGFDFTFNSTTWSLVLYSGTDVLENRSGTWSLGSADTWGSGTGNTGSSSMLMAVQNTGGSAGATGFKSFTIGSIEISTVAAVPEPSRFAFLGLALGAIVMRRRR